MRTTLETPAFNALPVDQLEDGDLIFIRIGNFLYSRVAATTQSWESHVGLAFHDPQRGWLVAESKVPLSRFTPLDDYLRRSEGGRVAVRRVRGGLTEPQKQALRRACEGRMGQWYHLGFNYDSGRLYCSKLVYEAYREALGLEVGELQTFRELILANPAAPVGFWRLWFGGFIPWARRVVTTTSQLMSAKLATVWEREPEGGRPRISVA